MTLPREPDAVPAGLRIVEHVGDDLEAVVSEQRAIGVRCETGMVERFAAERPHCHAVARPAGEHQSGMRRRVRAEDRKHPALIVPRQMKETVPREQAVERLPEGQRAHVGDVPSASRKTRPAEIDHRGRRVDAVNLIARSHEIARNRLARSAANVEDRAALGQQHFEALQPRVFG